MFFNENRQISLENITNVTRTAWLSIILNTFCKHDSFASNTVTNVTKYNICTYIIIYEEIQLSDIYIVIIFNYIT